MQSELILIRIYDQQISGKRAKADRVGAVQQLAVFYNAFNRNPPPHKKTHTHLDHMIYNIYS